MHHGELVELGLVHHDGLAVEPVGHLPWALGLSVGVVKHRPVEHTIDPSKVLCAVANELAHFIAFLKRQREALEQLRAVNGMEETGETDVLLAAPAVEPAAHGDEMGKVRLVSVLNVVHADADEVIGEPGNGWYQVTSELGYERSGTERFLSAFRVFVEFVRLAGPQSDPAAVDLIGRLASHIITLRQMSISVAAMLQDGKNPATEAALVKSLGNDFEKQLHELVRLVMPRLESTHPLRLALEKTLLHAPSFTIRGGTREILRGVIARGLGLR